jgi:hypothetical protein
MMKNVVGNWEFGPVYTFQSPEFVTVQSGIDVNGNGDAAGDRTFINPAGVKGTGTSYIPLCTSGAGFATNNVTCGNDPTNPILTNDPQTDPAIRPYVVGYAAFSPNAYYVQAGKFTRPNARRNTLAMPHTNNFDFTLVKRLNFTESQSLEFQVQAFNLFNHSQYVPGNISDVAPLGYTGANVYDILLPSSSGFNKPASVFSQHPRGLTLVLKYNF